MHDDQVTVDVDTVTRLVSEQFPQSADKPIRVGDTAATVGAIFRIGDTLAARFPLRQQEATQLRADLEREAAALHELAAVTTVPTPQPVALGQPGHGYPMPWSVQTWLPGHDATAEDPATSRRFGEDLRRLLLALRAADTRGRRFLRDRTGRAPAGP